jgi:group I intron endonuclease
MKYTIYKTTNKLNGKVYIGKHQTKNPYDNYMGSGKAIKKAIKQYGKENFEKEVLFIFDTAEEMDAKEKEIVNEAFISTNKTYNMGLGGEGGPMFNGLRHSEETRKKLADIQRGKKHSEETRKKISDANIRRGAHSEETKRKLAERAKQRWSDKFKR